MIGYDDLKDLTGMLAESEQSPDEGLRELGIDPDAVLQIARETAAKSKLLILGGTDPNVVLSAIFAAGFGLGVVAAQELEAASA